jgi:hypothetical protein
MGLGPQRYINYPLSLYFTNVGHKPHKCTHNKRNSMVGNQIQVRESRERMFALERSKGKKNI